MNLREIKKVLSHHKQLLTSMGIYIHECETRLKNNGYMHEKIIQLRAKHNIEHQNNQYMRLANGHEITFDLLMDVVSFYYQQEPELIKGPCRKRKFVTPRHMFAYLSKQYMPNIALTEIGAYLCGRDHSSVIHGRQNIQNFLGFDKKTQRDYSCIIQLLNAKIKQE
jgi:chromosomal replication initiation ATPase DnaA